jgi:glutamate dehydrogenase (NAD(P)+)
MIPPFMDALLRRHIPDSLLRGRTRRRDGRCHLVLGYRDEHLLSRMGIVPDTLGPKLVAFMWDETSPLEVGGYLVVDNLAMGSPSMGGIRMLPELTPADIHNLARGMTLKNAAAALPYGGGKSGIVADAGMDPAARRELMRAFARLLRRYRDMYVPGPDVGSTDADMKTIAIENGLDGAVSKPAEMGGNRIDELGAAAGGVVIALERLLDILPRLTVLPQFARLRVPGTDELSVLIQGFGAVGAHAARLLGARLPAAKVIGVSDIDGCLLDPGGLPVDELHALWRERGRVTLDWYEHRIRPHGRRHSTRFSTDPDQLLREPAFALIPAAPVSAYLADRPAGPGTVEIDRMGGWAVIVEGANTYSPDPNRKAARTRMEQRVFRERGVMIAVDYLVNSGGVIFAAQEQLVPTPPELQIPEERLGRREAVDAWLHARADDFADLAERRLKAGTAWREEAIRRNMTELVDRLAAHPELLPSPAAERITIGRLSERESERTARDILDPIPTVREDAPLEEAAALLVGSRSNIIAVLGPDRTLTGVVTTWDVTRAVAEGLGSTGVAAVMTRRVISADPSARIPDIVRELDQNRISAMPVVQDGRVLGMVSSDLLAQRYLPQLLRWPGR